MCSLTGSQVIALQSSRSSCCVKTVLCSAIITKADFHGVSISSYFFFTVQKKVCDILLLLLPLLSWDSVKFIPWGWYSALFWILIENNVDNSLMFQMLPTSDRGLISYSYCSACKEAWVYKQLGLDTTRTTDSNWPKEYSIPYNIMLST